MFHLVGFPSLLCTGAVLGQIPRHGVSFVGSTTNRDVQRAR